MKIIIAFDSFKGCLSASEACLAATKGLNGHTVITTPLSDGGEGLLDILTLHTQGTIIEVNAHDPLMNPCKAHYGIMGDQHTAIIEMAQTCGLSMIPDKKRNPEITTTFGLGEVIADASARGCTDFIIGIGGSATNDAGTGMMQALGYFFIGQDQQDIFEPMCGKMLANVETIDDTNVPPAIRNAHFTIICDVNNPLHGTNGAAFVYAPQKGADKAMVLRLDNNLKAFANNSPIANEKGAGAAGGMGFAFRRFFNATLKPGIDTVLDTIGFDSIIKGADLIITGEGQSDRQTLMGKVASGVLHRAQRQGIPVALLSGAISDKDILLQHGFSIVSSINEGCDMPLATLLKPETAMTNIHNSVSKVVLSSKG